MTVVLYNSSLVALRPIYAMRFVVTICTRMHRTDITSRERKNRTNLSQEVKETRLSLHVRPTSCYYKSHLVKLFVIYLEHACLIDQQSQLWI